MSFFEDLFRVFAEWVADWPEWLVWLVAIIGGAAMVAHFALWVMWHLGWLDEDEDDNVIPFPKDRP